MRNRQLQVITGKEIYYNILDAGNGPAFVEKEIMLKKESKEPDALKHNFFFEWLFSF